MHPCVGKEVQPAQIRARAHACVPDCVRACARVSTLLVLLLLLLLLLLAAADAQYSQLPARAYACTQTCVHIKQLAQSTQVTLPVLHKASASCPSQLMRQDEVEQRRMPNQYMSISLLLCVTNREVATSAFGIHA